jgi:hypothetical protein
LCGWYGYEVVLKGLIVPGTDLLINLEIVRAGSLGVVSLHAYGCDDIIDKESVLYYQLNKEHDDSLLYK